MDYFKTRRTIRRYSDRPLSDELIADMLDKAIHAPTCGSMQLYSVVVTRSDEGKSALAPAHFNQPCLTGAQAVLTFCADFNRFTRWCEQRGADPGFDNVQSFISAALDATILAQQFVTIAEMNGLGTCYLGTTSWNAPHDHRRSLAARTCGACNHGDRRLSGRKPGSATATAGFGFHTH